MGQSLWERFELDDDERLIFPNMYYKNRRLYGDIKERGYFIKHVNNSSSTIDWVKQSQLSRLDDLYGPIKILAEVLLVELRLPWKSMRGERIIDPEEFNNNRHQYSLLDVFLVTRDLKTNKKQLMLNAVEFETGRSRYELLEVRYLVVPKIPPEPKERLVIDKNHYNTFISI
jgi:hypothetical protein